MANEYDGLETLGGAAKRTNKAAMDFAQALDASNTELIGIQETYKAQKTAAIEQANELAAESDRIMVEQSRAMADPWNDLKVLFTDEKSVADYMVDQNLVQGKMNKLQRDNQQAVYEYQFRLGQVQQNLTELENRRRYGREDTAAIHAQDSAQINQMARQRTQRITQLEALSYKELINLRGEVASGKNTQVRDKELEEVIRWWEGASARAKGKSALDQKKEYWSFIDPVIVNRSVRTGNGFTYETPDGTFTFSKEEAVHIQAHQSKERAEMAKIDTETAVNVTNDAWQREHFAESLDRYSKSQGIDLYRQIPDPKNPARTISVLDYKKLPVGSPEQLAELQRLDSMIGERQERISEQGPDGIFADMDGNKPSSMRSLNLQAEVNNLMAERQTLLGELQTGMITDMQSMYATEGAKATSEQFIRKGQVVPSAHSREALTEVLVNDASIASSYSALSPGWSEVAYSLQDSLLTGFQSASESGDDELFETMADEDASPEERQLAIFQMVAAGTNKKKVLNIEMEALNETVVEKATGRNVNKHQQILINRWNNQTINYGLQKLLAQHANEPITQSAIRAVMEGDRGMSMKYLTDPSGVKALMYDLSKSSTAMHRQGSLPEDVNLAFKLEQILRDPDFLNGAQIRGMTTPKDHASVLIAAELFKNRQHAAFISTFDAQVGRLHLQDLDAERAATLADDIAKQKYGHTGRAITDDQYLESLNTAYDVIAKEAARKQGN